MSPSECSYLLIGMVLGSVLTLLFEGIRWAFRSFRFPNEERRSGEDRRKGDS
jgi:hypothetical protein